MDEEGFGRPVTNFSAGTRVELHPGCDRWMMGDRYGTVTSVKGDYVYVRLDKSRRRFPFETSRVRFARS